MFAEIHSTLLYQSRFCFDFDSGLSELTGSAKKWGKNRFSNFCAFVRKFTRELVGEGDLLTLSLSLQGVCRRRRRLLRPSAFYWVALRDRYCRFRYSTRGGSWLCLRIRLVHGRSLQNVEDPVAGVERRKAHRKDDPRVLVDHVDVLDLRDGRLDDGRAAPDRVQHLGPVVTWRRKKQRTKTSKSI